MRGRGPQAAESRSELRLTSIPNRSQPPSYELLCAVLSSGCPGVGGDEARSREHRLGRKALAKEAGPSQALRMLLEATSELL